MQTFLAGVAHDVSQIEKEGFAEIARGLRLGIGSSSKNTKLILSRLGLADFFDAVADGTEVSHSKPDPEVFLLAAEKLGVLPAEALVVEDADAGIQAAKAGGFLAAGIGPAALNPGADISLASLADLLHLYRMPKSSPQIFCNFTP